MPGERSGLEAVAQEESSESGGIGSPPRECVLTLEAEGIAERAQHLRSVRGAGERPEESEKKAGLCRAAPLLPERRLTEQSS